MRLRRSRFAQLIDAQLDLFEREHRAVIDDVRDRLEAYNRADRAEAEELYGDYVDAVETGTEILADMRDHYAATLDDADEYIQAFNSAVARRLPEYSLEIENR
jgi:isocitrate dehydrogenase kinase/phosphatase